MRSCCHVGCQHSLWNSETVTAGGFPDERELSQDCSGDKRAFPPVKIATASHDLRKMRGLKLLKYRNDGKLAYYSLKDRRVSDILSYYLQELV